MTAIIDYGAGNLKNVQNAADFLGYQTKITKDKGEILEAERIILPGVGAFGNAMRSLRADGLDEVIYQAVEKKIPFLGICLGLQVLFESSEESPDVKGLGILKGKIVKIPLGKGYKVPHMGWNSLEIKKNDGLFEGVKAHPYVYFVHSYYLEAENREDVAATVSYSKTLDVAVEKGSVWATQFHPEKSGELGLAILKNFFLRKREA